MKLSLGPVQYYWSRDKLLAFYDRMAETAVDVIYLGETVCSKRRALNPEEWIKLASKLQDAGKEVLLSSLALLEAESELLSLKRLCKNGKFRVEANDMGAIQLLSEAGGKFVAGPTVNIYNQATLKFLAAQGMQRWVMPTEISRDTLKDILADCPEDVETEILAYGRIPLAFSARCFTARAHNLPKDACEERCYEDPDGKTLLTREDSAFLALNGIQTQSAQTFNLIDQLANIKTMGVDLVRISPQSENTERVIELFKAVMDSKADATEASEELAVNMPVGPCSGYWFGEPGIDLVQASDYAQTMAGTE